jgi:hypothetical protein
MKNAELGPGGFGIGSARAGTERLWEGFFILHSAFFIPPFLSLL